MGQTPPTSSPIPPALDRPVPATPKDNPAEETDAPHLESLTTWSAQTLHELEKGNRLRRLLDGEPNGRLIVVDGREMVNLASNDYLGLSQHPRLIEAAIEAARKYGVGTGASRLVSGTQPIHTQTEERFAAFKHAEAALLLPTGYTANLAVLTTLAGPGDLIVMDKLVHASLIDAARASQAEVRTYPHLNLERAEQLLKRQSSGRRMLVSDSVFSMDGDCADLPALCDLADQYQASLIVDEAHGTGVLGNDGSGLASAQHVAERIYTCGTGGVVICTASKAMGCLGGLVCADKSVIDLLINKARPFIYSTAVPPAQAATISAALDVIREEPHRRARLTDIASRLEHALREQGWQIKSREHPTPIIPLIVGSEQSAIDLAVQLKASGFFAPAIRPPTVAPGQSRVRLSLRADLEDDDVERLIQAIGQEKPQA